MTFSSYIIHNETMKQLTRLPLYLGLIIFIFSVVLSGMKLGENNAAVTNTTNANQSGAVLTSRFVSPNLINVSFNSKKDVSEIYITFHYDKDMISVVPSSLSPGPSFNLKENIIDNDNGYFRFDAVTSLNNQKSGLVASFKIIPKNNLTTGKTAISFITGNHATFVTDYVTGGDVLLNTEDVTIKL